jgi:hypothetical protein
MFGFDIWFLKKNHMTWPPFHESPKNVMKGIQPSIAFYGYISITSKQVMCKSNVLSYQPFHFIENI